MADIESLLKEKRTFKPPTEFTRQANWNKKTTNEYRKLGDSNPTKFWAKMAKENVSWFKPWNKVLDWKPPFAKWFVGAKTNVSYNCLDRHLDDKTAPGKISRKTRLLSDSSAARNRNERPSSCLCQTSLAGS